jgi:hypothetical protein
MKKLFVSISIFALILTTCDNGTNGTTPTTPTILTTLKINNQSFTDLTDVIWQNVTFSNNQNENSIKVGTNVTMFVQAGDGYIYFKRKSNPIIARTSRPIKIEVGETAEFIFRDITSIVEENNPNNSGTLDSLQSTVIWWDDAEGEIQPYFLRQGDIEYYSGSAYDTFLSPSIGFSGYYYYHAPKNGNKAIRIGNYALLHLRITLTKKARLSFWYANYVGDPDDDGTIFSINGVKKTEWTTDINWSQYTIDLEQGENNLIWEKKDGYFNYYDDYYCYLSLDDILIYYLPE